MTNLFGSDSLFLEFDRQPGESSQIPQTVDLTEDSDKEAADPPQQKKTMKEKVREVAKFEFGDIMEDHTAMSMPSDWPLVSSLSALGDRPNYSSTFRDPMTAPEPEEDKPPQPRARPKMTCFNCGGSHMLSACKEKKDFAKIAQKRREFNEANPQAANRPNPQQIQQQQQQQSSNQPYSNTDLSGQIPPLVSFDHFKPGKISDVLRQALNLYPHQIPPYVYFLRELGYPPGWLEEARVPLGKDEISDVPLFDPKQIVEYPGYNLPMPADSVDETRHFRVKKFDSRHSADAMRHWMDCLKKHHDQRRAILSKNQTSHKQSHSAIHAGDDAMDLDDASGDESGEIAPTFEGVQGSNSSNDNSNSSTEVDIDQLTEERERLLRLLESTLSGNADADAADEEATGEEGEHKAGEDAQVTPAASTPAVPQSFSQSLGVSTGTPLPSDVMGTPVCVPSREKFAAGIGDHLPFQNLPESVGTFERLKNVLANIKKRQQTSRTSGQGVSASLPVTPQESSSNSAARNQRGYVDLDAPEDNEPRSNDRYRERSSDRDRDRRDNRQQGNYRSSDSRGYYSEPRSSSHRYRPY